MSAVWDAFEDLLRRAKRVFVLGHSLHDAVLVESLRRFVGAETWIAIAYLGERDGVGELNGEPANEQAYSDRARASALFPKAALVPIVFDAGCEFRSPWLLRWLAETG